MKKYEKDYVVACVEDKFKTLKIAMVKCVGDEIIVHYEVDRINYVFNSLKININNDLNCMCHDIIEKIMQEVRCVI